MKRKVITALMLVIVLVIGSMLAACGNSEGTSGGAAPAQTQAAAQADAGTQDQAAPAAQDNQAPDAQAPAEEGEDEGGEAPAGSGEYNVDWEDMEEIRMVFPCMSSIPTGLQAVQDAMNEIVEAEINAHITLEPIEVGNYIQQVNLMISGGEAIDLMVTFPAGPVSLAPMVSQKQLMDITDLVDEYAPRAKADLGDYVNACTFDGKIYALPAFRSYAAGIFIYMRADVLEDLGLMDKALNMTSFTEYEEILQAVKDSEKWGNLAGIMNSDTEGTLLPFCTSMEYTEKFADIKDMDTLGSSYIGVAFDDPTQTVVNAYDTDLYRNNFKLVQKWYDAGYVYKDANTSTEMGQELIASGIGFSMIAMTERQMREPVYTMYSSRCQHDMVNVMIHEQPVATSTVSKFTYAVPNSAQAPQAAVAFLELFYNNADLENLFAWGLEGVDYEIVDGVGQYIAGNETPAYHMVEFMGVNNFLIHPFGDQTADIREVQMELTKANPVSPFLGFTCDTDPISLELTAAANAVEEYGPQLNSGMASDADYEAFIKKLNDGNIQAIIDLYQTNLDAWLGK